MKTALVLAAAVAPIVGLSLDASAATVYWDLNGTAAGAGGPSPSGTFDTTTANFNPVADGTGTPQAFVPGATAGTGDVAVFSAGSDATGAYLVSQAAAAINAAGIVVEDGEVTLGATGGTGAVALGTTGGVAVNAGATLVTNSSARISFATGSTAGYTLDGGTLRTTNTGSAGSFVDVDAGIILGAAGGTLDYQTPNVLNIVNVPAVATATGGLISGPGSLTKTGAGVLAIVRAATYAGETIVNGGELRQRTNANVLPVTTALTVGASGIFNTNGLTQTVGSLSGGGLVGVGAGRLTVNGSTSTTFAGSIRNIANAGAAGTTGVGGGFTKNGTSVLTLTGDSTYNGTTIVTNGGLLLANASGQALSATVSIAVNAATASVSLGANDQIHNAAQVTLNGGTFSTGGLREGSAGAAGVGLLNLGANGGIVDFASGAASLLAFAESTAAPWAGSLKVYNYSGTPEAGNGIDQLYFGTAAGGLTAAQLAAVTFFADAGTTPVGTSAMQLSTGEVVPSLAAIPEPASLAAIAGLSMFAIVRRRRA